MGLESGHTADDDLTNLNWLQDQDLLKNVRSRLFSELNENRDPAAGIRAPVVVQPVTYDPRVHVHAKPPYSFSSLIFMAIESSSCKALLVKEIYSWIENNFPYYRTAPSGWKNTIRHNLSLNKCFRKVDKQDSDSCVNSNGKGSLWSVDPSLRQPLLQSVKRAAFHVYPYMSTPKTSPTTCSTTPGIRPSHAPAPKEVEAVESMLTLTQVKRAKTDAEITSNQSFPNVAGDPAFEHNYSTAIIDAAANRRPVGVSDQKVLLPSQVKITRRPISDGSGKISTPLDDDDDGLIGAEVLFNFSKRRLSN